MKQTLSVILAIIMLAALLASCATAPQTTSMISANIRTTSSDADTAAMWLTDRLGSALTDCVVLGTDASGYGVDVSARRRSRRQLNGILRRDRQENETA